MAPIILFPKNLEQLILVFTEWNKKWNDKENVQISTTKFKWLKLKHFDNTIPLDLDM